MEFLSFNSVELLPNAKASAAFMVDSGKVFREDICTLYYKILEFCLCLLLINHGNSWSLGNSFFFNMFASI